MEFSSFHNIRRFVPPTEIIFKTKCGLEDCKNTENLKKCGGCKFAKYCSKECQKKAWSKHKLPCKIGGFSLKPMRQNANRSVPFCSVCSEITMLCKCDDLDFGEGVLIQLTRDIPSYEDKSNKLQKWARKRTDADPTFNAEKFLQDCKVNNVLKVVETRTENIRAMTQNYIKKKNWKGNADTNKETDANTIAIIIVAVSKFIDFAFKEFNKLEVTLLEHLMNSTQPKGLPWEQDFTLMSVLILQLKAQVPK